MSFIETFLMVTVLLGAATIPAGLFMVGAIWLIRVVNDGRICGVAIAVWLLVVVSTAVWLLQLPVAAT